MKSKCIVMLWIAGLGAAGIKAAEGGQESMAKVSIQPTSGGRPVNRNYPRSVLEKSHTLQMMGLADTKVVSLQGIDPAMFGVVMRMVTTPNPGDALIEAGIIAKDLPELLALVDYLDFEDETKSIQEPHERYRMIDAVVKAINGNSNEQAIKTEIYQRNPVLVHHFGTYPVRSRTGPRQQEFSTYHYPLIERSQQANDSQPDCMVGVVIKAISSNGINGHKHSVFVEDAYPLSVLKQSSQVFANMVEDLGIEENGTFPLDFTKRPLQDIDPKMFDMVMQMAVSENPEAVLSKNGLNGPAGQDSNELKKFKLETLGRLLIVVDCLNIRDHTKPENDLARYRVMRTIQKALWKFDVVKGMVQAYFTGRFPGTLRNQNLLELIIGKNTQREGYEPLRYPAAEVEMATNALLAINASDPGYALNVIMALSDGANVNAADNYGITPLMFAVAVAGSKPNLEVVRLLLEEGAAVNAVDENGRTPLMWAVRSVNPNLEVVRLLLEEGADVNALDENGNMLLHRVLNIYVPNSEIVRMLLDAGANVNATNERGDTPLMLAVVMFTPTIGIVKLLLEAGANVNATNERGDTPLMLAVAYNSLEIVRMFLEAKAKVNAANNDGYTPLMRAVASCNPSLGIISMLLEAGGLVNVVRRGAHCHTPLMFAVDANRSDVVQILLDAGADGSVKNWVGETPLDSARKHGNQEIINLLLDQQRAAQDARAYAQED